MNVRQLINSLMDVCVDLNVEVPMKIKVRTSSGWSEQNISVTDYYVSNTGKLVVNLTRVPHLTFDDSVV
jgi:hypothetical protein